MHLLCPSAPILGLSLLMLGSEVAYCYLDTSPFFMFSTSELLTPTARLKSCTSLTSEVSQSLSRCPSDFYVLVSQPGVQAVDYSSRKSMPALSHHMKGASNLIRSSATIGEVVGEIDGYQWQSLLEEECGAQTIEVDATTGTIPSTFDKLPTLLNVGFPLPSRAQQKQDLRNHDDFLSAILDVVSTKNYTVLYMTTPGPSNRKAQAQEAKEYRMDTTPGEELHVDLKRDTGLHSWTARNNQTMVDGPLFEKYQFLTPGIYMGFLVGLLLLSILYGAISGLASLQVSYAAFDKENGPAAQKKAL